MIWGKVPALFFLRRLLPLVVLAALGLSGCTAAGPAVPVQAEEKEEGTLLGLVERVDSGTLSLVDRDGSRWTLALPAERPPLSPGETVEVHYQYRPSQWGSGQALSVTQTAPFLPEELGPGIFSDSYARAWEVYQTLTEEEKIGQLFLVRCSADRRDAVLAECRPAGFVLEEADFADRGRKEASAYTQELQRASALPLLLAVSEEGGAVAPVSSNRKLASNPLPAPADCYQSGGLVAVAEDAKRRADLLLGLGVNVTLSPVADCSTDPADWIHARTVGRPADETADYVATAVTALERQGLGSCLSHFPGLGSGGDPYGQLTEDTRPYEEFVRGDLLPFQAGIQAGAPCVLVGHTVVDCMDARRPASLSPAVQELLRTNLTFTGVSLADDLSAPSVWEASEGNPAVDALRAGNDLLLVTDPSAHVDAVMEALADGSLSQERVDAACLRVLSWKVHLGLLDR